MIRETLLKDGKFSSFELEVAGEEMGRPSPTKKAPAEPQAGAGPPAPGPRSAG